MKYTVCLFITSFLIGIFFSTYFLFEKSFSFFLILILVTLLFLKKRNIFLIILFVFFILGFFRGNFYENSFFLDEFVGEEVLVKGIVVEEPDKRENSIHYVIRLSEIKKPKEILNIKQKIRVTTSKFKEIEMGSLVEVTGKLKIPENFETDSGRTFDYENFLYKDKINYVMVFPGVRVLSESDNFSLTKELVGLKNVFVSKIMEIYPSPEAELMSGMLLGTKQSLGEDLLRDFQKTGLIHIVVLSGFNISIIISAFSKILSSFGRLSQSLILVLFIVSFILATGADPPSLRAGVMATIMLFSRVIYRETDVEITLFVAIFFMVMLKPPILIYDLSFQLSALATYGLIVLGEPFERMFKKVPETFGFRAILSSNIAVQVAVLPLLAYKIGEVSIIGLPVNILILPVVSMVMFFGFLSVIITIFIPFLSFLVALPASLLMKFMLVTVKYTASLKLATTLVPKSLFWIIMVMYVVTLAIWRYRSSPRPSSS